MSGSEGSEAAAELEEKEVIALQQRMAAALRDTDFQAPSLAVCNNLLHSHFKVHVFILSVCDWSLDDYFFLCVVQMMEKSDVEAAALKEERVVQDLSRLSKEDKLAVSGSILSYSIL